MTKLSPKHRIFVREYLKDRNASRAYIAAGYGKKNAAISASRLLKNVKVAVAIDQGMAKLEAKLDITAERNLRRIAEIAYHDPVAKRSDVLKACELLGRHHKQFTDVQEVSGPDGGPQVVLTMPANGSEAEK